MEVRILFRAYAIGWCLLLAFRRWWRTYRDVASRHAPELCLASLLRPLSDTLMPARPFAHVLELVDRLV